MPHPSALDVNSKHRIDEILARPVLARLGTASPDTLQPHVVPVWFYWDGECLWISGFRSTRKFRELERNPRCAVVVDGGGPPPAEQPPTWGVLLKGQAELITSPTEFVVEQSVRIYTRYLGEAGVRDPEPQSWIHDAENTLIRLAPQNIYVW
jgi:nitroimidazol reductase NimA-like FMN-containing flavoprotein (pyridoxamine 5'-phosphate oxidase superfamily)